VKELTALGGLDHGPMGPLTEELVELGIPRPEIKKLHSVIAPAPARGVRTRMSPAFPLTTGLFPFSSPRPS